ncbi:MAG: AAA-type ATPase lid domain-containing protein [Eubacteriales bacterium]
MYPPPLRLREHDLDLIADYIYANIQSQTGITIQNFDDLKGLFMVYDWPGNIRQLENIIRYAAILSVETGNAHLDDIRKRLSETGEGSISRQEDEATVYIRSGVTLQKLNEELEMKALKVALKNSNYNKTLASSILGISRQTFYQKMHQYKIINGG